MQQLHWSKLLYGMHGLAPKSSISRLNFFGLLIRWCNQHKLLHHYFQTVLSVFKIWCNQNKLLHHYFQQFWTCLKYDAIKTNYCITIFKNLQNSWHFWTVEEFRIYFICTAKFLTFSDGGGIQDLSYLYCKIPDISRRWRNLGSILFVLQNSRHFWTVVDFEIYFICTAKFLTLSDGE